MAHMLFLQRLLLRPKPAAAFLAVEAEEESGALTRDKLLLLGQGLVMVFHRL